MAGFLDQSYKSSRNPAGHDLLFRTGEPDVLSTKLEQNALERERRKKERERERERIHESNMFPSCGSDRNFITTDECRQNLKEGVQSVQDICAGNPGLGRFQLSPPPVAVSIASVW